MSEEIKPTQALTPSPLVKSSPDDEQRKQTKKEDDPKQENDDNSPKQKNKGLFDEYV
ncbi:MAG: hypothetical protein HRT92_07620 [Piscirickettsiaceae bacterium]|nr:hypothetical protein [Piscirickettsiaceae bacterium]